MSDGSRGSSRLTSAVVLLGYFALTVVLMARGMITHLDSRCLCTESADPIQFVWAMVWWPHAIGSGLNPVLTHAIWAPGPFDLATATGVPLAALVATPVTLTVGPLASYNLAVILSPTLGAFFAFRLCRYVTGSLPSSLVGGFVFGFSGYVLGQMIGHLNLMMVFFIPLAAHLVLRRLDGEIGRRRFVVSIALVLAGQALLSTELLFTGLIFGAIALLATALFSEREERLRLRQVSAEVLLGGVAAAVVISPFLYYALFYEAQPDFLSAARISMDALNPVVPTPVQRLGRTTFAPVAGLFPGGYAEAGGYLGLAFVILGGWWMAVNWRGRAARVMLVTLVCTVIGSLGTHLYISGQPTVWLPWDALAHVPFLHEVVPVRFALYTSLIVGIAVARSLAIRSGGATVLRWGLAVIGIAMLLPSGGSLLFHSTPPDPEFFTTDQYKRYLDRDETVLALPYSQRGPSLLWQARTKMWFRLAGGYFGQSPPDAYASEPAVSQLLLGVADSQTPCLLKTFIERKDVGAVVLETTSTEPFRPALVALGLRHRAVGGVDLYRVPARMATPSGCA